MSRSLGPRARVRTRIVRGEEIHELLTYRGAGPPRAVRFPTRDQAERQCAIALAELDAGTLDAPSDWPGMIEAFLDGRPGLRRDTCTTYRHRLTAVALVFERRDPLTIAASDSVTFWRARERDGVSPTTIRAEIDMLAILQRWCVKRGWCRVATWADVERPEPRRRESHLRPEEIGAFLRAAEKLGQEPPGERMVEDWHHWPLAAWLLMHGLRSSEVQHLRVRDIDLVHGIVHVRAACLPPLRSVVTSAHPRSWGLLAPAPSTGTASHRRRYPARPVLSIAPCGCTSRPAAAVRVCYPERAGRAFKRQRPAVRPGV